MTLMAIELFCINRMQKVKGQINFYNEQRLPTQG